MPLKKVVVTVKQENGFRTECKAGKHTVIIDQPPPGGTDAGPTPLDVQLMSLGGCIAAIGRIIAMQRKLPVRGFEITVGGNLDTDRLLGKGGDKRVGFFEINVGVKVDADMSPEEKEKFVHEIDLRCPISDNLQNMTEVKIKAV